MSEELFSDIPQVKSPRLLWMEKHGLTITKTDFKTGDEDPESGEELFPFYAVTRTGRGYGGATEHEALAAWAVARGVPLWNEEGFK